MSKPHYYSLRQITKMNALYNVIFGERSNGKTSAVLELILKNWVEHGKQGAYVRRYDEEIKGRMGEQVFASIAHERDLVSKYTNGEWTGVTYYNRRWYLSKWDENLQRTIKQNDPFCHSFAISMAANYKGTAYPNITTICFDEMLQRKPYMVNEYVECMNLFSTIIRQRSDVKIYMLGNTVSKFCPYFDEMGLTKIDEMEPGAIDIYTFGKNNTTTVAVEYCNPTADGKKSDKYFAFDNPRLKMITSGAWELPMYPHAPFKIEQKNIISMFFIEHRDKLLQGDIVIQDDSLFVYIHKKTTELKDNGDLMVYRMVQSPKFNHGIKIIGNRRNRMTKTISDLFEKNLVYFQDNTTGELVKNYLEESSKADSVI